MTHNKYEKDDNNCDNCKAKEELEDLEDFADLCKAIKDDDGIRYSHQQVLNELEFIS